MEKLEKDDIILLTPPSLSEQSYAILAKVDEFLDNDINVKTLLYLDTRSMSNQSHRGIIKVREYTIKENFKQITIEEFMDIHPEYFI